MDFTPFHPAAVHFPIALFITAFGLEILSWILRKKFFHQCAICLYVMAALMTPFILRTGVWETERLHLSHNHPVLKEHHSFAAWTMWLSLMSLPFFWFFSQKAYRLFRVLFIFCLIGTAVLITFTGDRGGRMVFEYGAGVEE